MELSDFTPITGYVLVPPKVAVTQSLKLELVEVSWWKPVGKLPEKTWIVPTKYG